MSQTDDYNRLRQDTNSASMPGDEASKEIGQEGGRDRRVRQLERQSLNLAALELASLYYSNVSSRLHFEELRRAGGLDFYPTESIRGVFIQKTEFGVTTLTIPRDYNQPLLRRGFHLPWALYRFARAYLRRYRTLTEKGAIHDIFRTESVRGDFSVFLELPGKAVDNPLETDG